MDQKDVCQMLKENVSHETFQKLEIYVALLNQWNSKINLVSKHDASRLWQRHIVDSFQMANFISPQALSLVDLGSGGGFPGLVLSLVTSLTVTLIESDRRKTIFLSEVARETGSTVRIICGRIENTKIPKVDIVTARALAPLKQLIKFSQYFLNKDGYCLFLKGKNVDSEIEKAKTMYKFHYEKIPSLIDDNGVILKLSPMEWFKKEC
ncbi:Ribosomal RNA small subunit methyltransferase G [Commensalibacter sp. Nvir]|uniref:16S rRNA (guanine(527)-N(7))-methyltransferase RsmG n=1 Tax=Commensalibacter sp. Nvir TaxID=3069817 RepID=UPI002D42AA68|nr:Ribosomal RNA small subunit methyltransferase G [Commensalibacter sp. Nvir]